MDSKRKATEIGAHALGVRTDDPNFFTERDNSKIPVLSDIERRAYQAAWRIDREPISASVNELSCKSTRHARYIDHIARIIQEEMGR